MTKNNLRPMDTAPRDGTEILAYHITGKNFHPVAWQDWEWKENHLTKWGMRWNSEYTAQDSAFSGWIPYPRVEETSALYKEWCQKCDGTGMSKFTIGTVESQTYCSCDVGMQTFNADRDKLADKLNGPLTTADLDVIIDQ